MATRNPKPGLTTGALKLSRSSRKKGEPGARVMAPAEQLLSLEEVMVGFQKSLARATRASLETSRAESDIGLGDRALYVVDAVNVSLKAIMVAGVNEHGRISAIGVDLATQEPALQSTLEFRVQAKPIEAISQPELILADLDPLGLRLPRHCLRGTLIARSAETAGNERSLRPQPGKRVTLTMIGGDTRESETLTLTTNPVGQFEIELDASSNTVSYGDRQGKLERIRLTERDDDFFVFATHESDEGTRLISNMLHFNVRRSSTRAKE